MKKLMVTLIGVSVLVLLISGGCGTDANVDWSEFFNEYYSECVSFCNACSFLAENCGDPVYDVDTCINTFWNNGVRNLDCRGYIKDVNYWITIVNCNPVGNKCLF